MTNQEAIQMLKSKIDGSVDTSYEWCECVRLAINALESTDVISRKEVLELIESFKVESTHELSKSDFDRNDTLRLLQDTIKGVTLDDVFGGQFAKNNPTQQDIYKAVLGLDAPENALTTVQEMNEKAKEVKNITDEWDRVWMSGDKRAIAQYKADHGYTMTKEEMDILEEEK